MKRSGGFGGLCARSMAVLLLGSLVSCARREPHPPVILISIDTLRADRLSVATTPHLMELARQSTQFRNAWAECPLTLPSHLSIFTGLLPPRHGVRDNVGYQFDAQAHPTLAALLRRQGYRTGAAVSAYVLRASSGASAGFDDYDDAIGIVDGAPVGALQRRGGVAEKIAEQWIAGHEGQPFFYFLHLYEPHTPYEPTYDADVHRADAIVGDLLAFLRRRQLFDRALVIVLSDHGEGLSDHGEAEHGVFLYREALQVPLLMKLPGSRSATAVDTPVQLADVLATVAGVVHMRAPQTDGRDLFSSSKQPADRSLYSESLYPRLHLGWSELRSIVKGGLQVIDAPSLEAYDLKRDPGELTNIAGAERRAASLARTEAQRIGGTFAQPGAVDPEEARKLAALGYVSSGADTGGDLPDPKSRIADLARLKELAIPRGHGNDPDRITSMERLLAANPRWSDVRDQLGAAYDAEGEHTKAAAVFEEGIRVTPRLASQFALSAATSLAEAGDLDRAVAHALIAGGADAPAAHLLLGEIALARGDAASAAREAASASAPAQLAHVRFLEARIAGKRHDFSLALQLLGDAERQCSLTGESLPRHFHAVAGDALAESGRANEAARELELGIAEDPRDPESYVSLAFVQAVAGDKESASRTLARMTAARPEATTYRIAARCLDQLGDRGGAARFRAQAASAR